MSSTNALKAVIFDVDGVLINSIPIHIRGFNKAFAKHGFEWTDIPGDHRASSLKHILATIKAERGVDIDFDAFRAEIRQPINDELKHTKPDPNLLALLRSISSTGIKLAIGTSSTRPAIDFKLQTLGIGKFFSVIVTAEDVDKHKPEPDIYLKDLEKLRLKPSQCVVIEDAPAGVQAAKAAGIPVVSFGKYNDDPYAHFGADLHVSDWPELSVPVLRSVVSEHGTLAGRWNWSNSAVPGHKDPSAYARDRVKLFPPHSRVCDLGGGIGTDSLLFLQLGHTVDLVDISDFGLAQAARKANDLGLADALSVHQADLTFGRVPLKAGTCDVVYSRLSLHYFRRSTLQKLLGEVHRILRPGGQAFLTLKSPDDAYEMAHLRKSCEEVEPGVYREGIVLKARFTAGELRDILRDAGMTEDEAKVERHTEIFDGRTDKVRSGNTKMICHEIRITKAA